MEDSRPEIGKWENQLKGSKGRRMALLPNWTSVSLREPPQWDKGQVWFRADAVAQNRSRKRDYWAAGVLWEKMIGEKVTCGMRTENSTMIPKSLHWRWATDVYCEQQGPVSVWLRLEKISRD